MLECQRFADTPFPDNKPLADFLPTLIIKAKDFAAELTSHNVVEKDLRGEQMIVKKRLKTEENKVLKGVKKGKKN